MTTLLVHHPCADLKLRGPLATSSFAWTQECEDSFEELKQILTSDRVLANYDPTKATRLYVDDGPTGVAVTIAQLHEVQGIDHQLWRPVVCTSQAKTKTEVNYGKVDGESLS